MKFIVEDNDDDLINVGMMSHIYIDTETYYDEKSHRTKISEEQYIYAIDNRGEKIILALYDTYEEAQQVLKALQEFIASENDNIFKMP